MKQSVYYYERSACIVMKEMYCYEKNMLLRKKDKLRNDKCIVMKEVYCYETKSLLFIYT